eukprot:287486-Rhodomonas_salina.1
MSAARFQPPRSPRNLCPPFRFRPAPSPYPACKLPANSSRMLLWAGFDHTARAPACDAAAEPRRCRAALETVRSQTLDPYSSKPQAKTCEKHEPPNQKPAGRDDGDNQFVILLRMRRQLQDRSGWRARKRRDQWLAGDLPPVEGVSVPIPQPQTLDRDPRP